MDEFAAFCQSKGIETVPLASYRGNRFNIIFFSTLLAFTSWLHLWWNSSGSETLTDYYRLSKLIWLFRSSSLAAERLV